MGKSIRHKWVNLNKVQTEVNYESLLAFQNMLCGTRCVFYVFAYKEDCFVHIRTRKAQISLHSWVV